MINCKYDKIGKILIRSIFYVAGVDCTVNEFQCKTRDGVRCLPNTYKCDQVQDCEDNEDEENCPGNFFFFWSHPHLSHT